MKNKVYILIAVSILTALAASQAWSADDAESSQEYKIKAAFIYNFIKYIDWPEKKLSAEKDDDPIVIGVIGVNPFGEALEPITKKTVKNKKLAVRYFPGFEQAGKKYNDKNTENLRNCCVLFVSFSEKKYFREITELLNDSHVLTVSNVLTISEADGFLEAGGIINFVTEKEKVNFSINLDAAKRAEIVIPTTILKIAKKVIHEQKKEKG